MKKDWRYIALLALAIGFTMFVRMMGPRQFDWTVTFHPNDKNPFGGYVLNEMFKDIFDPQDIHRTNSTFYELLDTTKNPVNILSVSTHFDPGQEDQRALLGNTANGADVFIAA